jgi:hypothetical protein
VAVLPGCGALAVGSQPTGLGTQSLAERWDGSRWRQVPVRDPGAGLTPGSGLAGVAAGPGGDAWAVGWYSAARSGTFPLAERWDGTGWRRVRVLSPGPGPRPQARLLAVAVSSSARAWAVGDYAAAGGGLRALIERWDGHSWRAARVPVPAGSARSVLDGIVVVSPTDVWAVGYQAARAGRAGGSRPLAEHWDGTAWRVVPVTDPAGPRGTGELAAVSAAAGQVWAAGWSAAEGGAARPLAERWDGRAWRVARAPVPAGALRSALHGIAAVSPGLVVAVGWQARGGRTMPLAERWDGRSWHVMAGSAGPGSLAAVAAAGSGPGWAVGSGPGQRGLVPLALQLSGRSWRQTAVPSDAVPLAAATAGRAAALAAATGQPVEVTGELTEYQRVYAVPQGGFAARVSLVPQQVQATPGGPWVPVSTTLTRRNGRVAPAATAADLSLSAGGSGPLYTLTSGADTLSVTWPYGPLPAPALSGPTATYAGVLPGVNLLVSATDTGVQVLIEVTSADAAANPDLASITFPVTSAGISLSEDSLGNLTATDSSGSPLFTAATPQMWDSSGNTQETGPTGGPADGQVPANSPQPGDLQANVGVQVGAASASLTLTPATSVLSGPGVTYPVFIDPNWNSETTGQPSWSDVVEFVQNGAVTGDGHHWEPQDPAGGITSGTPCDSDTNGTCNAGTQYEIYRSFLNFPVPSAIQGAVFADGELELDQTYAWGCTGASYVTMWDTSSGGSNTPSTTSTTWANQPAPGDWLSNSDYGYGHDPGQCPGQYISLPATQAAQAAAAHSWPWLTVRLSANTADEALTSLNPYSWKRFDAGTMILDLYWRNPPAAPTNYGTQGVLNPQTGQAQTDCGSVNSPDWVSTNAPVWQAQFADPDWMGGSLTAEFPWVNVTTPSDAGTLDADQNPTGQAPPALFTASRAGAAGDEYKWQAYASTEAATDPVGTPVPPLQGPASFPWCYFTVDTTPPAAPTISSPDYTSGVASNPVGTQGTFNFAAPAGADPAAVAGFVYGIDNPRPSAYVPASGSGAASIRLAPFSIAEEDLYVASVDQAGNVSPVTGPFRIEATASGNIATLGWWKLNGDGTDSNAVSSSGLGLTISGLAAYKCPGSATASPAGYTCSLALDGLSTDATGVAVMGNDTSFSVSAWVYPSSCPMAVCTAVSQDGANMSGFRLGYQPSGTAGSGGVACPCWVFGMPRSDSASAVWQEAAAPAAAATGKWTQLTGVFAAGHGTLTLYVNGSAVGTGFASPWSAPAIGPFRVGDDMAGSGDFFTGSVSDVCAFYGALAGGDVQRLYASGSADGCAALAATYP